MPLSCVEFELTEVEFTRIHALYPNMGKNADVGKAAIEIVKWYFKSIDDTVVFPSPSNSVDLVVKLKDSIESFEVKGTAKSQIDWNSLRVSSENSHELLAGGMRIIRVCGVGTRKIRMYYLRFGVDFTMIPEPRWRITRVR